MTKAVLSLDLNDNKTKKKAMRIVSDFSGVYSISMDPKDRKKMTLTGDMDPVDVVKKLRKVCNTNIISFGPEKEEPKKPAEEKKKDDVVAHQYIHSYPLYYPYSVPQYYLGM